ncbi:hypothetical protein KTE28_18470 [Burkholderia multivorans]|uniref:hypothetical protein n=1 Tax=Burkholderia multivorans TaxID=87883 RepID=UPI00158EED8C|nr:hypothetical protein [Burkholderia multivorans]MBU9376314.1 hypothetical protein [Burkholderia multivorans]MDN7844485.1 hypothetical protein [Burkholderia multivorans]
MSESKELCRFVARGEQRVSPGQYETRIECNVDGWIYIEQAGVSGMAISTSTSDLVALDPNSALELYLTLKKHFED